jgi:hypothetical protein
MPSTPIKGGMSTSLDIVTMVKGAHSRNRYGFASKEAKELRMIDAF